MKPSDASVIAKPHLGIVEVSPETISPVKTFWAGPQVPGRRKLVRSRLRWLPNRWPSQ